ncbi:MAG: alpha/beta fold hydrolase [Planctomycetota bacterium]
MCRARFASPSLVLLLTLTCGFAAGQDLGARRYDLGKRLIRFERALAAAHPTATGRERAIAAMERAVRSFFGLDLAAAARAIDDGTAALVSEAAEAEPARALWSIAPLLGSRVVEPGARVRLTLAGTTSATFPLEVTVAAGERRESHRFAAPADGEASVSCEFTAPDDEGDHAVLVELACGTARASYPEQILSVVREAGARSEGLSRRLVDLPREPALERSTLEFLLRQARPVLDGRTLETDLRVGALLKRAESLALSIASGSQRIGPTDPGDHLLRVPLGSRGVVVRILVPPTLPVAGERRLVLALHGAGGSENLFFDGYGFGLAVRRSAEQSTVFVAPRNVSAGDVAPLLDILADRFGVERGAVDVVGHSMGAATALAAAQRSPGHFRRIALVGGGGRVTDPSALLTIPCLLVTGGRDFARGQVLASYRALRAAEHPAVELIEFPWVEHMLVVQVGLPDVFAFFGR